MTAGARWLDPEVLRNEQLQVFGGSWLMACAAARVAAPGAFAVFDLGDSSTILWRDADGVLRAFANACPHRGTRLLEGCGRTPNIVCPYHAFSYGADGGLLVAPHLDVAPTLKLVPQPVEERYGLVWLDFGCAQTLAEYLEPLDAELQPRDLAGLRLDSEVSVELHCNWKISADVHGEALHVPSLHPEIAAAVDHRGAKITRLAPHARRDVEPRVDDLGTNVLLYIFPNLHLNLHADYALIFRHRPHAADPTRCSFDQIALSSAGGASAHPPQPPRSVTLDDAAIGPVTSADLRIAERVQRGLATGQVEPQLTQPERLLSWMLEEIDRRLRDA